VEILWITSEGAGEGWQVCVICCTLPDTKKAKKTF